VTWLPFRLPIVASSMEPTFNLTDPDTDEPIRSAEGLFAVAVDPER
jgi:hypothetical protein